MEPREPTARLGATESQRLRQAFRVGLIVPRLKVSLRIVPVALTLGAGPFFLNELRSL